MDLLSLKLYQQLTLKNIQVWRRSQDGRGIGLGDHFLSYKFIERTMNTEQTSQDNFWLLAEVIRRPEKQPIVFKDQTQRTNIKSNKGETTNNTQRDSYKDNCWLSIETLQARREWQDILKVMKENNLQPRSLYPARISFRYEEEFKSFTEKQKLRQFSLTKPALQQMLKDLL